MLPQQLLLLAGGEFLRNALGHCYLEGRWASTTPAVGWGRGALTDDAEEVVQILATLVAQHDLILRV